jgi:RNA polymerase sigma-B factor
VTAKHSAEEPARGRRADDIADDARPDAPEDAGREPDDPRREAKALELERFRRYKATGDRAIRDAIVADAQGIAIGLARRFRDRGAELDDLIQVAQIGLLKAVEGFDPERGVAFISFATPTVLGELRRHFRTVWSVRMPRGLQELSQRLAPSVAELHQELGRSPTIDEVAVRVGLSRDQVLEAMEAGAAFRASSLDNAQIGGSERRTTESREFASATADADMDKVESRQTVEALLPLLSDRTRRIVELRFYEERSQSEIAEIVGVSQMHVSRLLRQAMDQLGQVLRSAEEESTDPFG